MDINKLQVSIRDEHKKIEIENLAKELETLAKELHSFAENGASVETVDNICGSLSDIAIDLKFCNIDLVYLAEYTVASSKM